MFAAGALAQAGPLEAAARGRPTEPIEADLEGSVVRCERRAVRQVAVELRRVAAVAGTSAPLASRVRLIERADAPTPLAAALPGDRLRLRARLRAPVSRANPGGADRDRALARRGVGAIGSPVHPDLVVRVAEAEGLRPLAPVHRLRARVGARLLARGEGGALLAALGVGERGGLTPALRDALRRLGLSHLVAVSGLHLAITGGLGFAGAFAGLRRLGGVRDARRSALGTALAVATAYALLAGFGVPVRRALLLLVGLVASVGLRRPVRRGAPLVAAAIAILALEPQALFEPGAQMSFAASAALLFGMGRSARPPLPERRWRRALREMLASSALATAATAPWAALAIGQVSVWGLLANLVAIPWTAFVLLPTALAATGLAGFASDGEWAASALAAATWIASQSLEGLREAAAWVPAPWTAQPSRLALAAASGLALLAVRAGTLRARAPLALAAVAVLALGPAPAIRPAPPRLVALDVGQGDALLVQGRAGALLVDAGLALPGGPDLGATVVVPALRALGVERLDLLVASHADLDHRGGLPAVLAALPVDRVWLPRGSAGDPAYRALRDAAVAAGAPIEERGQGDPALEVGDLRVEPLWPPSVPAQAAPLRDNDRSLALRVEVAGRTLLLPGDLEADGERRLLGSGAPLRADVLKLGHHGSRSSSSATWLAAVGGEVALASAPRFGRFGMPHPEVVTRTHAAGYALWWTGRDGAVLVGLEPVVHVRGWRR